MSRQNNCDGGGPHRSGEVRVLPIGGGGNLILCRACYGHEVGREMDRQRADGVPNSAWQIPLKWELLKIYWEDGKPEGGGE
jgi:hypothetical protein